MYTKNEYQFTNEFVTAAAILAKGYRILLDSQTHNVKSKSVIMKVKSFGAQAVGK